MLQFSSPQHNDITKAVEYKNHTSSDSSHPARLGSDHALIDLLGETSYFPPASRDPDLIRNFPDLIQSFGIRSSRPGPGQVGAFRFRPFKCVVQVEAHPSPSGPICTFGIKKIVVIFMKNKL